MSIVACLFSSWSSGNTFSLILLLSSMILIKYQILEYVTPQGTNPFRLWLASLPVFVAARVQARLYRAELGNLGDFKSVGDGVFELRIHMSPGYRLYYGREGRTIILLLAGGTKSSQNRDITKAKRNWKLYQGEPHVTKKR